MSCSDVKVSCPSFKWWMFVLLSLPLIFCTIFQTLFIGVWQINLETKLCQEVCRFCSSSFRPEDAEIAEIVRCRMFSELSFGLFAICDVNFAIINHGLSGCFGFVEVFGLVLSAIDITFPLSFKIGAVAFRIISFPFEVFLCTSVGTEASQLCQIYTAYVFHQQ